MKNKHLLVFIFSIIVFSANALLEKKVKIQDKKIVTVVGVFDGYDEEDGYAFLIKDEVDDSEEYIFFTDISQEAFKAVNLRSKELIGKSFEITYEISEFEEEEEDGNVETYEKFTIIKIKKL
jgi:hypothetical protein